MSEKASPVKLGAARGGVRPHERTAASRGPGETGPHVVVLSSLFPSPARPLAGVFVLERMRRVAECLPVTVVSPVPWSPFDWLVRRLRPEFRPSAPETAEYDGLRVRYPRFPSLPTLLKRWDGAAMALALRRPLRALRAAGRFDLLDAHFGYPDGYAAVLIGRRLGIPVTVTFRGTEARLAHSNWARRRLEFVAREADRVFTVSDSLRRVALTLGAEPDRVEVVPNGVDSERFSPVDQAEARRRLGIPPSAKVLITVGGLVERKGQHRVIELMPGLLGEYPDLHYLVVGGGGAEGDWSVRLTAQVEALGLQDRVHFLGSMAPDDLPVPLSAADIFVLATRNEGWANVILEAMACGLPVVATDVGGNAEIIATREVGRVVPFGDPDALRETIVDALASTWNRQAITAYARSNGWEHRIETLIAHFRERRLGARVRAEAKA